METMNCRAFLSTLAAPFLPQRWFTPAKESRLHRQYRTGVMLNRLIP